MTERFVLGVSEKGLGLRDNQTGENYYETEDTHLIRLCELLNELDGELHLQNWRNKQLHKTIEDRDAYITNCMKYKIHLKNQLDIAIQNERTELGRSVLRQFKESIE